MFKKEGYILEYEAVFAGGPADGLNDSVIVVNGKIPPKFTFFEINGQEIVPTNVKSKFFNVFFSKNPKKDAKVAIYKLSNEEEEYDDEEDSLLYSYVGVEKYSDYCNNY